jgi:hypothetical protein
MDAAGRRPHSLGWVTARQPDGALVGFVNVAWDGGDHAFLLDTKVATENQRQGILCGIDIADRDGNDLEFHVHEASR